MAVDEPWCDRAAGQIDDARVRTDEGANPVCGAHRRDRAASDGKALRHRISRIDGQHVAVDKHQIGRSRGRLLRVQRRRQRRGKQNPLRNAVHDRTLYTNHHRLSNRWVGWVKVGPGESSGSG